MKLRLLCAIVLLILVTSTVPAQFPQKSDGLDSHAAADEVSLVRKGSRAEIELFHRIDSKHRIMTILEHIEESILAEFHKAWSLSAEGISGREGVVLIFRMEDGRYRGVLQGYTNEYQKLTFGWRANVVAIVHTHPNSTDPKPSQGDQRLSVERDVPIFTISTAGMFAYSPDTKTISKVVNGLEWLKISTWRERYFSAGQQ